MSRTQLLFSYYFSRAHRELHSFPTRRSSDLTPSSYSRSSSARRAPSTASYSEATPQNRRPRSEEHTSELQSRQYLVCRLLLEKKKRKPICSPQVLNSRSSSSPFRPLW